jgi:hypothetical protein
MLVEEIGGFLDRFRLDVAQCVHRLPLKKLNKQPQINTDEHGWHCPLKAQSVVSYICVYLCSSVVSFAFRRLDRVP